MKSPNPRSLVLLAFAAAASTALPAKEIGLDWRRQKDNGATEAVPELAAQPRRPFGTAVVVQPDGSKKSVELFAYDMKTMRGHAPYAAALPAGIRAKPTFVDFILAGTVGSNPDNGTILNIDGAVLGLQPIKIGKASAPHLIARVMARGASKTGDQAWLPTRMTVGIDKRTGLTVSPRMGVRLDPAKGTWSLFLSDIRVSDDLPLIGRSASPQISIRPGTVDTDVAELKQIKISNKPYQRNALYLPSTDGKIDLQKAFQEHDPRLRAPGGANFMLPTH